MPVFSYLALPKQGQLDELSSELGSIPNCEATPADNQEIIVLVTDTPDEESEKKLQKQLAQIKSLQSLSMTFGHSDEEQAGG